MRVFVTGASGFIGRRVVHYLVRGGHDARVLLEDRDGESASFQESLALHRTSIQSYTGDLKDHAFVSDLLGQLQPEAIIHLAAVGVSDPFLDYETAITNNILGTVHLATAYFEGFRGSQTIGKMVLARTPGERTNMNMYAASKAGAWGFCDMFARTNNWPINGAIIYQAYGPGQPVHTFVTAAMTAALKGQDFPMSSGRQIRDWIYVDDVARGLIAMIEADLKPGTSLDLGSGSPLSLGQMAIRIYELVGGKGRPLTGAIPDRPGEELSQIADAERTSRYLGWQPEIPVNEGLAALKNVLLQAGEKPS